jgi:glycosyltransferase involved in cell wall biosynthesis
VRLLLLADVLDNGGQERQMSLLAASMPPSWEVRLWSMGGGPFEAYLRERGVPVTIARRHSRFDPLPAVALLPVLRDYRPDVVHAWSWMAGLAAAPQCRALGVPIVNGMIRSGRVDHDFARLKRLGLALATLVVANSRAGLAAWNVSPAKGRVVYNGFDESRLAALDAPGGAGLPPGPAGRFTVVMTGRMTKVKHYDVVIEAARRLREAPGGFRFVLVGDGPDRARLLEAARDLVAAGVVEFPEPGTEVLGLVRQADVGVLLTNPAYANEGLSNSIMEYMALGLPVVCGDGGGNPELVRDGVSGFVVPQGDVDRLVERLVWLREHDAERRAMGAAGRDHVQSGLSVTAMVDGMLEVYDEAAFRLGRLLWAAGAARRP